MREIDQRSSTGSETLLSLSKERGVVPRAELGFDGEGRADSLIGYKRVSPGVLVMNKMQAWNGMFGLSTLTGIVSPEYTTLLPLSSADPRFLVYLLRSDFYVGEFSWRSRGMGTAFLRLHPENLLDTPFFVPAVEAQRVIADYLDAETARIDALIAKKQRMIELLDERLMGLLAHAISEAGGELIKLGQVLERIIDYRGATPEKVDYGVVLLTASNVVDGRINLDIERQFVSEETYQSWMRRGWPETGDIVFTTEAPLGAVALLTEPRVALAQRLMLFRPRRKIVSSEYLYLYLLSSKGAAEVWKRASGSTVMGIRTDRLRDVPVGVPLLEAQAVVVERVRAFQRRRDAARLRLLSQIDLLRERRRALITAAVTGELEVPGVAA